ncbi:hypothetical protein A2160_01185 [Candidatus Beckwithbacteria bacterium RBG_13_42_9]|uniref:CopG-like ribbon-helix-helix domain-containing protein n=1 Tax=Candidatus Beckwithbacteria bacterium RBG_13_42_9 TaxID=1797457 RepID=A0A1F5E3M7_9BACT|nr:MAG: hypothetical protein A2160_01185 [Candidatus Beckwithbacteria bacterium RBG_13_42_9]
MQRTQIYLPKDLYEELIFLAKKVKLPMAEIVRKILIKGLEKKEFLAKEENDLIDLADLKLTGGPKNLSQKMDKYLYG